MAPIEAASDGEPSCKAAQSQVDSGDGSPTGDGVEVEELPDDYSEQAPEIEVGKLGGTIRKKTSRDDPAPVTPIGKLARIPSVEPLDTDIQPIQPISPPKHKDTTPKQLPLHEIPKDHLVGKTVDEWGDIVDDDGAVLGRVEGDLPSMVGRKISNARGDILGDNSELLGYVAAVAGNHQTSKDQPNAGDQQEPTEDKKESTRSLDEVMKAMAAAGKGPGGLKVDPSGNILDAEGNLVGSFHDKTTGFGRKSGAFPDTDDSDNGSESKPRKSKPRKKSKSRPRESEAKPTPVSDAPEGTATERRDKAQAQSREQDPLNPSDIFLDVKSTTEGIQLTIRIPTVFSSRGEPVKPKIVFE